MFRQEPKKGLGDFDIEEEVKVGGLFKPKEIKVEESKEDLQKKKQQEDEMA